MIYLIFTKFLASVFIFSTVKLICFFVTMRAPLVLLHIIVLRSLVLRGWWWMGTIPFLGITILSIWWYQRQQHVGNEVRLSAQHILESYGVVVARSVMLLGIWQLIQIFGLLTFTTGFRLLGAHMLVYLGAILLQKKDIAMMAHGGWWVSGALITRQSTQFHDWGLVMDIVSMMISLSFAMYACIVFVLGTLGNKIDRRIPALLFIFFQLTILVGVIYYADTFSIRTLLGGQIYLGVLYGMLQWVYNESHLPFQRSDEEGEDLLQLILRGEQVQGQQTLIDTKSVSLRDLVLQIGKEVIQKLPDWSFRFLAAINLFFMSIQLFLVLWGKTGDVGIRIDIGFRVSIAVYIMNYLVLQQQHIDVWGQRAMTFFLINFGIYLTIYHVFGNIPLYLVGCGVVWSLANAFFMINLRTSSFHTLLTESDYQYWLLGNMIAIIANSYFMFLLPLSLQLRFTLVMIYLAFQALLLKYQLAPMKRNYGKS